MDAKTAKSLLPVATASFIFSKASCTAVPPASASTPILENAAPIPAISEARSLATDPAPAIRLANSTIWLSVVAELFPNATTEEANRSTSFCDISITLAIWANDVEADSSVRFVVTATLAMTSVKESRSALAMPNCPPISPIPASAFTLTGISPAKSRNCCRRASPSLFSIPSASTNPFTVLITPAKALSNSIELCTAILTNAAPAAPAAITAALNPATKAPPAILPILPSAPTSSEAFLDFCPSLSTSPEVSCDFLPSWSTSPLACLASLPSSPTGDSARLATSPSWSTSPLAFLAPTPNRSKSSPARSAPVASRSMSLCAALVPLPSHWEVIKNCSLELAIIAQKKGGACASQR